MSTTSDSSLSLEKEDFLQLEVTRQFNLRKKIIKSKGKNIEKYVREEPRPVKMRKGSNRSKHASTLTSVSVATPVHASVNTEPIDNEREIFESSSGIVENEAGKPKILSTKVKNPNILF